MLPTKTRPTVPGAASPPASSITLTIAPRGTRPTVAGSATRSSGVAIVAKATSVEP